MKSIITRRGIAPAIHRWIYANGWQAASAFGFVSCLAFPFFAVPSACLFFLAVGLAALRICVDFLEQLIAAIEEDSESREGLAAYRIGSGPVEEDTDDAPEEDDLDHQVKIVKTYDDWELLELEE